MIHSGTVPELNGTAPEVVVDCASTLTDRTVAKTAAMSLAFVNIIAGGYVDGGGINH